jgi:hypothetical protein
MQKETPSPIMNRSAEAERRRRGRSWAILIVLLGLCALFYAITIVKLVRP